MANYHAIKAAVNAYIKRNGRKEITGTILNSVLNATIDSLGRFFQFAGMASPSVDPGTPDQNVCYLAGEPGVYTYFGGITLGNEEIALLFWDGEWTKQGVLIGIQEVNASVDNQSGTPSVDVGYTEGVLTLTFHNLKGDPGTPGTPGAAAGFGTVGADVDGNIGTPGVTVQTSGPDTAKNLMFHFTNLKGETGVTSVVATVDNTSGTPSCQVSLVGQQLTLAFSGLKGLKGDTGVSADYPITIYNGLDSDATDAALAAAQGKVLQGEITELEAEKADKGDFSYNNVSKGASAFELQGFFGTTKTKESDFSTNSSFLSHIFTGLEPGTKIYYDVRVNSNCNRFTAINATGDIIDTNVASDGAVFQQGYYTVPANAVKVYLTVRNDVSFVADQTYWLHYDLQDDVNETVRFTAQALTNSQKTQARTNIGAFGEGDSLFVKVKNGGASYFTKNGYLAKTDTNVSDMHTGSTWFWRKLNVNAGEKFDYALSAGGSVMMVAAVGAGGTILDYVVGAGAGTMSYGTYTVPANTVYVIVTTYETKLADSFINEYVYLDALVKEIGGGGIVERNGIVETTNKLMQGKRGLGTSTVKQVSLLQFSDIHANEDALKNVVEFFNYYGQQIDDVIHCGDTVQTYWSSDADVAFWASAGANSFLNTIGNHDSATYNGSYDWDGVSEADCYDRYLAPYIAGWGVTYTEGKCYYYKDYTGANLRVIVLDEMHYGQTQHDWFVGVLASAITAGYDVLCVIHSTVLGIVTKVSTFASSEKTSTGIGALSPSPLDAVDNFINAGGHFACWLDGHTHFDDCGYVNGHPNQLHICITTQNWLQTSGADTDRTVGEKQEDAFNVISVDSATHKLRVFRIGADYDRLLRHKGVMCYDYANNQLIFNG